MRPRAWLRRMFALHAIPPALKPIQTGGKTLKSRRLVPSSNRRVSASLVLSGLKQMSHPQLRAQQDSLNRSQALCFAWKKEGA
ncbi:hypothetical protein KC361_g215 [Hortaea werneckii]|nr:hypothetical protein KC361_g215 [Hortaea werneckii]